MKNIKKKHKRPMIYSGSENSKGDSYIHSSNTQYESFIKGISK